MSLYITVDGSTAGGNPGIIGTGIVIHDQDTGELLWLEHKSHRRGTNNESEYLAISDALTIAAREFPTHNDVVVWSDSQLVNRQLRGMYKIRQAHLQPLYKEIKRLSNDHFNSVLFRWHRREDHWATIADELSRIDPTEETIDRWIFLWEAQNDEVPCTIAETARQNIKKAD